MSDHVPSNPPGGPPPGGGAPLQSPGPAAADPDSMARRPAERGSSPVSEALPRTAPPIRAGTGPDAAMGQGSGGLGSGGLGAADCNAALERARDRLRKDEADGPLLSLRLSDHIRGLIRIAAMPLDAIYDLIASEEIIRLETLQAQPDTLAPDELTDAFRTALLAGRLANEAFLAAIRDGHGEDIDDLDYPLAERSLRDRIRDRLGMPRSRAVAGVQSRGALARAEGLPDHYDLPLSNKAKDKGAGPTGLQTLLTRSECARKHDELLALHLEARSARGTGAAYAVFGVLRWRDPEGARRLAPLLLQPIAPLPLQREDGDCGRLRGQSAALQLNPLLADVLDDLGVALPSWREGEPPAAYLARATPVLEARADWQVLPQALLGAFDLTPARLIADLAPWRWPMAAGRGAGAFLTADPVSPPETECFDFEPETALDDALAQGAIAIEAPTGTDDADAVRALVTAAWSRGESVLVVSPKWASLERIGAALRAPFRDQDLGPFVLDGRAADRRAGQILAALRARHDLGETELAAIPDAGATKDELEQLESILEALDAPFGATGLTPDVIFRRTKDVRALASPPPFETLDIPQAEQFTPERQERCRRAIEALETAWSQARKSGLSAPEASPWARLSDAFSSENLANLIPDLDRWIEALSTLEKAGTHLAERFGTSVPATRGHVSALVAMVPDGRILRTIQADPVLETILPVLAEPAHESAARRLHGLWKQLDAIDTDLRRAFDDVSAVTGRTDDMALLVQAWTRSTAPRETLSAIRTRMDDLEAQVDTIGKDRSFLASLVEPLGIRPPDTPQDLDLLQEAAALIEDVPRAGLTANRERLAEADGPALLADIGEDVRTLRARHKSLNRHMKIGQPANPRTLAQAAGILARTSPMMRLFSRRYAKAIKIRNRYLRKPIRPKAAPAMLRTLSDYHARVMDFQRREHPHALLGPVFRGINTDLSVVNALNHFMDGTWHLRQAGAFGELLSEALHTRPADRLMVFAQEMASGAGAHADLIRKRMIRAGADSLETLDLNLQMRQDASDHILALSNSLGLLDEVGLAQATDALTRLRQRSNLVSNELPPLAEAMTALEGAGYERDRPQRRQATLSVIDGMVPPKGLSVDPARWRKIILTSPALKDVAALEEARTAAAAAVADCTMLETEIGNRIGQSISSLTGKSAERELSFEDAKAWAKAAKAIDPAVGQTVSRTRAAAIDSGLAPLIEALERNAIREGLRALFEKVFFLSLSRRLAHHPVLGTMKAPDRAKLDHRCAELRVALQDALKTSLRRDLLRRPLPPGAGGLTPESARERSLLPHVLNETLPVARLYDRAPQSLQALMPCWLTDPGSLPILVPDPQTVFDLVIVTDAGACAETDALSGALRARKAIIIGDPAQIGPPPRPGPHLDWARPEPGPDKRPQPLFSAAAERSGIATQLDTLLADADPDLTAFAYCLGHGEPVETAEAPHGRLSIRRVTGFAPGPVNEEEARRIVEAALHHVTHSPDLSLGICAATAAQANLIRSLLMEQAADPALSAFRARWAGGHWQFGVHTADSAMGYIWDRTLVSLVCARARPSWPAPRSFWAFSREDGLQVLTTLLARARGGVTVFSSLTADEMPPGSDSIDQPPGVRGLHALLSLMGPSAPDTEGA